VSRTYAGVGSRRTPGDVLVLAQMVAERLDERGWTLRSGHAPGADQAFELGAGDNAEVYLPWPSFENSEPLQARVIFDKPRPPAYDIAESHHPHWPTLKQGAQALHARNVHQILGPTLVHPVKFVLCWTPDAATDTTGSDTGGTGQAIRLANAHSIPVFNLARDDHRSRVESLL
jgi:hypothetical protein